MILSRWLGGGGAAPQASVEWTTFDPLSPFWYQDRPGVQTDAGVFVGPETITRCGTVLAALRFLGDAVGLCTPQVFIDRGDRREPDRDHYLHRTLRKPNAWQVGYRWRHHVMFNLGCYGKSPHRIVAGPDSFADELRPLHPACFKVIEQKRDGSLLYEYRPPNGDAPEKLRQDEVLHFRGISADGMDGLPMHELIRQTVGVALAAERHIGTFLKKGTRLSGVLSTPNALEKDVKERFKASWAEAYSGSDQVGKVPLLESGMTFTPMTMEHSKAQMLELTDNQVGAILRFLGVPGVVVGYGEKTATYASAKEFFQEGGIKHCLLPWLENLEDEIDNALIARDDPHYVKFNLDVLLRASLKDRYDAYFKATGRPWMTVNEARRDEDMNPDPDPASDKIGVPVNMGETFAEDEQPEPAAPPTMRPRPKPAPADPEEEARVRRASVAEQLAVNMAARVVRRELAAMSDPRRIKLAAADPKRWAGFVSDWYQAHAVHVSEAMALPAEEARAYADGQRDALLAGGLGVLATWEDTAVPRLADLVLGG